MATPASSRRASRRSSFGSSPYGHRRPQHQLRLLAEDHRRDGREALVARLVDGEAVRDHAQHGRAGRADAVGQQPVIRLSQVEREPVREATRAQAGHDRQHDARQHDEQEQRRRVQVHPWGAAGRRRLLHEAQRLDVGQRKALQREHRQRGREQERQQRVHLGRIEEGAFPSGRVLRQHAARVQRRDRTEREAAAAARWIVRPSRRCVSLAVSCDHSVKYCAMPAASGAGSLRGSAALPTERRRNSCGLAQPVRFDGTSAHTTSARYTSRFHARIAAIVAPTAGRRGADCRCGPAPPRPSKPAMGSSTASIGQQAAALAERGKRGRALGQPLEDQFLLSG